MEDSPARTTRHRAESAMQDVRETADTVRENAKEAVAAIKPKLRGWLHLGTTPLALAAGIVLVALAPTTSARIASAIFAITAVLLFGTSAIYHRGSGHFSDRTSRVLKRLDHANIFLIIAGTYTPFAVLLLPEGQGRTLLWLAWGGAVLGVLFRVFWVGAPRWLYTPVYVALGWVAIFYVPGFWRNGGAVVVALIAAGGLLYTLGAVVYGTKRPNPSPRWFGFHEIFHAFTVVAFAAHYIAVSFSVYGAIPAAAG
ncbi:PAQR family membrane homeostasis protein TrhA [Ornithinimicrobium faecis]